MKPICASYAAVPGRRRWHWRVIHVCEWIADVHLFIYPLLVVAFFWWLAYGHR